MRRFTRPLAFVGGAALAVAGVVGLTALPGQADTVQVTKLELPAGGYTMLNTTTNQVTSTTSATTQALTVGCSLADVLSPAATLLDVNVASPNGAKLGYGKNGIGVSGRQDKSGTRCADVDSEYGQSLEVRVGSAGGVWSAADLDIEFKGGSSLTWEAFRGGSPVPATAITVTGLPGQAGDNGPDSGDGDNWRVVFQANNSLGQFDRLVLKPTVNGALSLEGGGDGTGPSTLLPTTSASVFMTAGVGEGTLLCDLDDVDGVTDAGVNVVFTNCPNGSSVPYQIDRTGNDIILALPASSTNAYRVMITWTPETAVLPVPDNSKVAYYREVGGDVVQQDLDLCDGTAASPTVPPIPAAPGTPGVPNGQGFCIIGQSMEIGPASGQMVVTEKLYGVGDPAFGRLSN
jgi:hypothetical protein